MGPREAGRRSVAPKLPKGMGRVVDETGAPIVDAVVSIHADHNAGKPMERLRTDRNGHFRLPIGEERIDVVRAK
ncbi:MAG: carboxypeptidase-like regulatory domain-containing protein, partial [Planctomycetota bacterium]